ncbi:MAG TPA: tRNA guanosine(34) transglycosylase Tgt, partial [candidate division Zixibacteria bacterium]|nr:tRNA guanosine(34) transglycosylase Tgt [candidate division Zixibacteria bacterium]
MIKFSATDNNTRRGEISTAHGIFQTPAFMPVGTSGAVKALTSGDLEECGAEIILGNTYHLYLRPGTETVKKMGGLAGFSGWNKPTLTDSGGFQIFSLKDISKVTDQGVEFQSHHDGSKHFFSPEKAIQVQHDLGADIIMQLDECVPYPVDEKVAVRAVERTIQWGEKCLNEHNRLKSISKNRISLFGIVQGSVYPELRKKSAEQTVSLEFDGNAIGGLSVGESKSEMEEMLALTIELLPKEKPRYLMGVGYPENILMAVSYGIDMFDCVLPTRNARTGNVFTSTGQLVYRNAEYANDERPLDQNCQCKVCQRYSRAYLRHLYNQSEITAMVLASYHSTYFYQHLMKEIR